MASKAGDARENVFRKALEGYRHELGGLVELSRSDVFARLLPWFSDYPMLLASGRSAFLDGDPMALLAGTGTRGQSAWMAGDPVLGRVRACMDLAAFCELFAGWTIPVTGLARNQVDSYLQTALASAPTDQETLGRHLGVRLNSGDAMRVVQMLRLLGLLDADLSGRHQLGLGASEGTRDIQAVHGIPVIQPLAPFQARAPFRFGVQRQHAASTVLIDSNPEVAVTYADYAAAPGNVTGLNVDLMTGLAELADAVARGQRHPVGLVTAFRIDPRAFAEPDTLLPALGRVIDRQADLVLTMGSGHDEGEYRHRVEVMGSLRSALADRGLRPLRVEWHQGSPFKPPLFGLSHYASYEVLHCRLERGALQT